MFFYNPIFLFYRLGIIYEYLDLSIRMLECFNALAKIKLEVFKQRLDLRLLNKVLFSYCFFMPYFLGKTKAAAQIYVYSIRTRLGCFLGVVRLMLIYHMNICYVFYNFVHIISILYIYF